jgi:hypothetical protein
LILKGNNLKEIIFRTPQEYLNYDFDDNFCFYFDELQAIAQSVKIIDPDSAPMTNFDQEFGKIIHGLFQIYECLILQPDEEKLFGEINGVRFFIRESKREE